MKIIEILADSSYLEALQSIADRLKTADHWVGPQGKDGRHEIRFLVNPEKRQETLDALQAVLGNSETAKWFLMPVEAALPGEPSWRCAAALLRDTGEIARPCPYEHTPATPSHRQPLCAEPVSCAACPVGEPPAKAIPR